MTTKTNDQPGDLVMATENKALTDFMKREMPEGTVIGNPRYWSLRISGFLDTLTPPAEAQVAGGGHAAGLEAAARFVDQRREAYDDECGSTDPETGTREYPGTGDEYVGELLEIAEGIRAIAALSAQPRPVATVCQDNTIALVATGVELSPGTKLFARQPCPDKGLRPAAVDELSASEAVFAFAAWLTCRPEVLPVGATADAAPIAQLVGQFCKAQGLSEPRDDYHTRIKRDAQPQVAGHE